VQIFVAGLDGMKRLKVQECCGVEADAIDVATIVATIVATLVASICTASLFLYAVLKMNN